MKQECHYCRFYEIDEMMFNGAIAAKALGIYRPGREKTGRCRRRCVADGQPMVNGWEDWCGQFEARPNSAICLNNRQ